MSPLPDHPTPDEVEDHFRGLIDQAGLEQPDEVIHDTFAEEVIFLWEEPKFAVVVELGPDGPVDVRRAVNGFEPPV